METDRITLKQGSREAGFHTTHVAFSARVTQLTGSSLPCIRRCALGDGCRQCMLGRAGGAGLGSVGRSLFSSMSRAMGSMGAKECPLTPPKPQTDELQTATLALG